MWIKEKLKGMSPEVLKCMYVSLWFLMLACLAFVLNVWYTNFMKSNNDPETMQDIIPMIDSRETLVLQYHNNPYTQTNAKYNGVIQKTEVVVFIPSPLPWHERRQYVNDLFIHQRWLPFQVHYVYMIGTKAGKYMELTLDTSKVQYEEMEKYKHVENIHYIFTECRDFGDEPNNPDGTSATTCKVYQGFLHASRNFDCKYVWRGSDDGYLNLKFFFNTVVPMLPPPEMNSSLYMGNLRDPAQTHWLGEASDLLLSKQPDLQRQVWRMHSFGAYMTGMGFMVTKNVADFISSWTIPPQDTWCEDVVVGAWLMPFKIQWVDANKHGWQMRDRNDFNHQRCNFQLLVHYVQPDDWKHVNNNTGNMQFCM